MVITHIQRRSGWFFCGLFAIILLMGQAANAQQSNTEKSSTVIHFTEKSWQDIKAMAKQQHKMIFVDAYAVWCAPCKQLKVQTFRDQQVAAYFNQRFINVSIEVEKGEGMTLADEFEVTAYPTLLWLDENGKLIKRWEGFVNAKELLTMAIRETKPD